MKIFLTGASSFIGKRIVKKLLEENHNTTVLEHKTPVPCSDKLSTIKGDITNTETLKGKIAGHDALIHLAGAVGYGQTMRHCLLTNKNGTINIAKEAVKAGIKRFIHMSSVSVYGRVPNIPVTEDFPYKKIGDPYGDSKIDAEMVLKDYAEKGKLELTIIRPTVVYGPGDNKFFPKLLENTLNKRARLIGNGKQRINLIHVDDLSSFVLLILKEKKSIGRIYNITIPEKVTWKEFLEFFCSEIGVPVPKTIPYPLAYLGASLMELVAHIAESEPRLTRYAVRVIGKDYNYTTSRMEKELNFKPNIQLKEGIRECLKEYNNIYK